MMGGGVLLLVLGFLNHKIATATTQTVLWAGTAGGLLCIIWGLLALLGWRRRTGVVLTLIVVTLVLLMPAINGWLEKPDGQSANYLSALLITMMVVISVALKIYVLHAGDENAPMPSSSCHSGK